MKSWYVQKQDFNLGQFKRKFSNLAKIDYSALKLNTKPIYNENLKRDYSYRKKTKLPKGYLELLKQKRHSNSTVKTYSAYFRDFIHFKTAVIFIQTRRISDVSEGNNKRRN